MVFCAAEGGGRQDIAFPHQSEIKVNGGEIKANLRGLKNKPGSTRPVDITKELRLNIAQYSNNVEMTYALTSKVGGRSEVSFLNPNPPFPIIPSCMSPFAPCFYT
jgi:E3 SUMO-protein ligase PIAS1